MQRLYIVLVLATLLASCSTHRTATIGWEGDKVRLKVTPPGGGTLFSSPALTCLTCNEVVPTFAVDLDDNGSSLFYLGEADERIAHRFYFSAAGIDTALLLQQPSPKEAAAKYELEKPLTGRIVALDYALVYADKDMKQVIGVLERRDEANIFGEDETFFYVHHPKYKSEVYVLKTNCMKR
jgi:hypothetical protein